MEESIEGKESKVVRTPATEQMMTKSEGYLERQTCGNQQKLYEKAEDWNKNHTKEAAGKLLIHRNN